VFTLGLRNLCMHHFGDGLIHTFGPYMWTDNFVQQRDLFSLGWHYVPSAKNYHLGLSYDDFGINFWPRGNVSHSCPLQQLYNAYGYAKRHIARTLSPKIRKN